MCIFTMVRAIALICSVVMHLHAIVQGQSLPGAPINMFVVSDSNYIGVQWEAPTETYGVIRKYIVNYAILPNITEVNTILSGDVTMALIAVKAYPGRLFRIRVSAQNDAGIGPASHPKYVRIECGRVFDIFPLSNVTVTSPGFDDVTDLSAGVLCEWKFRTLQKYSLLIVFHELNLLDDSNSHSDPLRAKSDPSNCTKNYVNITGHTIMCLTPYPGFSFDTNSDNISIMLKTIEPGGRGFKLTVYSDVMLPGPPTLISTHSTDHAVLVAWDEPREATFPITAYHIRYGITSVSNTFLIVVGASMRNFAINTDKYEGKLVHLNISAVIGRKEGQSSRTFYIRAPCVRRIYLENTQSVNISSPGYPSQYPSNVICVWYVTSPGNTALHITYYDFRLEDTLFCSSDYITLSTDYPLQPKCSDMTLPMTSVLDVNAFNLTFRSDNVNEYPGFLIEIKATARAAQGTTTFTTTMTSSFILTKITESDGGLGTTKHNLTNGTTTTHQSVTDVNTEPQGNKPVTTPEVANLHTSPMTSASSGGTSFSAETQNNNRPQSSPTAAGGILTSPQNQVSLQLPTELPPFAIINTTTSETMTSQNSSAAQEATLDRNISTYCATSIASELRSDDATLDTNDVTVTIVLSLVGAMLLVSLVITYTCVRKTRGRFKIHAAAIGRISHPIELHDIIVNTSKDSHVKTQNYSTFSTHAHAQTGTFWRRKLEPVCEIAEPGHYWGYHDRSLERPKKRRYSFPCCFSAQQRKMHRDIDRTLSAFAFIEDTAALESALYRKHRLRRTNSL